MSTLSNIKVKLSEENINNINAFIRVRDDINAARVAHNKVISDLNKKRDFIIGLKDYSVENKPLYEQVVTLNGQIDTENRAYKVANEERTKARKDSINAFFANDAESDGLYNSYLAYVCNNGVNATFDMKRNNGKSKEITLNSKDSFAGLLKKFVIANGLRRVDGENMFPITDYFKRVIGGKVDRKNSDNFITALGKDAFKEFMVSALIQIILETGSYAIIDGALFTA